MKKVTVGSGLTTYSVVTYTGDEWSLIERIALERALTTYPEYLLQLRDWATAVLTKAGRPTEDKMVNVAIDDTWRYVPDVSKFEHDGAAKLIRGLNYSQHEEEESLAWYASQILRHLNVELDMLRPPKRVRSHSKTRAQSAQQRRLYELSSRANAYHLGVLVERVRWKFRHEKAALSGHDHAASEASWQAAGARAQKAKGDKTTAALQPYFDAVLKGTFGRKRPALADLERLKPSWIIRQIRKIRIASADDKAVADLSDSTIRRHVIGLLQRRMDASQK